MGKDQLLELGFLTEEEKEKLQKVLAADENLQKTQYNHFIKKHKDLYNERKQCSSTADDSVCPLCFIKFGWFTNSGDVCPVEACQLKVCNSCRVATSTAWICLLCHKEKDLKAQAGYWFQQPAKNKKRVKTGTDILKKSLDTTLYHTRKPSPCLLDLAANGEVKASTAGSSEAPQQEASAAPTSEPDFDAPSPSPPSPPPPQPTVTEKHVPNHTVPETDIPVINHVVQTPPSTKSVPKPVPPPDHKNLKAPHIRDIKGQSLSADSGFINDDLTKDDCISELISEDDDDSSSQFQRYLMARSVAPDELAPQADTPPPTPPMELKNKRESDESNSQNVETASSHQQQQAEEQAMSGGASSSNISCESISPSPTMIKANTKDRVINGELNIGLVYNDTVNTLDVHINEGRNLIGVDGNPPHCYVKTYLLPDRSKTAKRKTKTKKRASNPVFNEIFQYKASSAEDLASMTLWLTVWDTRQLGHNMFLGEVRIQLDSVALDNPKAMWWPLQHMEDSHFRGSILLGLMYCPAPDDKKKKKTCLKLKVAEARDLPVMDNGRTNPYAALYLVPKTESKDHKYKLQMKKNTVHPKWNAEVNFMHLDSATIEDQGIEIQLLHLGKVDKAKQCVLIGVVRLCQHKVNVSPSLDGRGIEVLHWKEALSKPGVWVEKWHNLRSWE